MVVMGYPEWTLLGMGLSLLGALIALAFAMLGQSPDLTTRLGLAGARLDLQVRSFTTYAFALLLLAIGFFLAGIPIESDSVATQSSDATDDLASTGEAGTPSSVADMGAEQDNSTQEVTSTKPTTPETGAFSGPPPSISGQSPESQSDSAGDGADPDTGDAISEDEPTGPVSAASTRNTSTPTRIATATPTQTPSPTITPTPISGETATVNSGGSTVWIARSPGGQNLTLVRDGDVVILLSGHANQGGVLWREVSTVNGISGWIQELFIEN
jgi:hypothetical protein